LFLALVAVVRGAVVPVPVAAAVAPLAKLEEFDAVPQYSFAYDVQDAVTGDSKAQYETRNGDIVQGSYSLIEADGTRRIVEYTADPINGFNAIVSREPATAAIASAVATPILPFRPAALTPIAPVAAPTPSIPAVGPDSDVEVVEARTGPLRTRPITREQEIQREQLEQLQRLQEQQRQQQQEQRLQQLQQLQEQQRQSSRLQNQQQQQQQQQSQLRTEGQRQQEQQQQREQHRPQQLSAVSARTVIAGQPSTADRLVGLPAAARAIATYPTYPYIAYSSAYSSPFAYAAPLAGLTYATPAAVAAAPA